jgi:hypothetical protein
MDPNTANKAIDQLNSFLRGEISAVETYRQALDKVQDPSLRSQLTGLQRSHVERCDLLRGRIAAVGGQPAEGSGAWGAWSKLVQGGANIFGTGPALAALREGEEHGYKDYQRDLNDLDPASADLIRNRVLPEAQRTCNAITQLAQTVSA